MDKTATLSRNRDNTYNLLIQDLKGRILVHLRNIPYEKVMEEINRNMEDEA